MQLPSSENTTFRKSIDSFKSELGETIKFWPRNAMKKLTLQKDRIFLQSMMTDRVASIQGVDKNGMADEEEALKEKTAAEKREKKNREQLENQFATAEISDGSDGDDNDGSSDVEFDTSSPSKIGHRKSVKTGLTVQIPPHILKDKKVVQSLVRNQVTSTAISSVFHDIVVALDGDPNKLCLSYASAERYRVESTEAISEDIAENWTPPCVGSVLWDGKLLSTLDNKDKSERLPVLVSGVGGTKLLGVPSIPHHSTESAGDLISAATVDLLQQWDCKNCVAGMVFDTTSANTGCRTAACVALQKKNWKDTFYGLLAVTMLVK